MILTEKNGLRILTPKSSRYIIKIKNSDVYSEKIYLGKNSSLDDYEEVNKLTLEDFDIFDVLANELDAVTDKIDLLSDEYDAMFIENAVQVALLQLML